MSVRRRSLLAGVLALPLAGCVSGRPTVTGGGTSSGSGSVLPASDGPDAHALERALRAGDRGAFLALFADGDAGQALGARLWGSWSALGVSSVRPGSVPGGQRVGWGNVLEDVASRSSGGRLVQVLKAASAPEPLWLADPVKARAASSSVVAWCEGVDDAHASRWLAAAAQAVPVVGRANLGPAAQDWAGGLVVELPRPERFGAVASLSVESAAATEAATIVPASGSGAVIVGNGTVGARLDDAALRTMLVHEGVHAAMRSPQLSAPGWAIEGIAESVAQASDPETATRNAQRVAAAASPRALPADADLNGDDALTAYALAAVAVDAAIARWGRPGFTGWLADWSAPTRPSDADLTAAYLAALPG